MRKGENVNAKSLNQRLDSSTSRVYQLSEGKGTFEGDFEVCYLKDRDYDKTRNGSGWYPRRVDCARAGERTKGTSCHLLSIYEYTEPGVLHTLSHGS